MLVNYFVDRARSRLSDVLWLAILFDPGVCVCKIAFPRFRPFPYWLTVLLLSYSVRGMLHVLCRACVFWIGGAEPGRAPA